MCGIIGIVGKTEVTNRLVESLRHLEYRGYDSAGIATLVNDHIEIRKVTGKIKALSNELISNPLTGVIGIGHTRWATHGAAVLKNAHPFKTERLAIVHNGIIENYAELKESLLAKGITFESDTDTEVIAKLIDEHMNNGLSEIEAVKQTLGQLEGAFAITILFTSNDNLMIGAKQGAPLAIGIGENEMYLGSDALALSPHTSQIVYLEDGEIAIIDRNGYKIMKYGGQDVKREPRKINCDSKQLGKGNYPHFMLKEIYEQPAVVAQAFNYYFDTDKKEFRFAQLGLDLSKYKRVHIIACGSSYHAAMVAKYQFEKFAKVPVEIDISSEFRYRNAILDRDSLAIFISQSGETADTLAALKYVKDLEIDIAAIVNVQESTIAHAAKYVLPICAGFEIGVASTKAFVAQLIVLSSMCLALCKDKKTISEQEFSRYILDFINLPDKITDVLALVEDIQSIASSITYARSMIYTGRGAALAIALEGALKLKELSYIHAEGVAAGELKHGPIALIDDKLPVVAISPSDELFAKTASNLHEISARAGRIIAFTDSKGCKELEKISHKIIQLPETNAFTGPIIYTIPVQLLAYYTAVLLEKDVDQPRNLAKSVTVE